MLILLILSAYLIRWRRRNNGAPIDIINNALAVSLSGKVRVNSISPGWIETGGEVYSGPDEGQHPAGRVGRPEDIANMA